MASPERIEYAGAIQHVFARAVFGRRIFADDPDRRRFLRRLTDTVDRYGWECLLYCLLGTHYHLLLRTPRPNLALGMQELHSTYALGFNLRHDRHGHVFSERYASVPVRTDDQLFRTIRYITRNPVEAGIAATPGDWRWSSHRALVGTAPAPKLLSVTAVLAFFDNDPARARARYAALVDSAATASVSGTSQTVPSGGSVISAECSCSFHGSSSASIPSPLPTSPPP